MIRVTIELVECGDESRKKLLHTLEIANRWRVPSYSESSTLRQYEMNLDGAGWEESVQHYRDQPIWVLLRKVMETLSL